MNVSGTNKQKYDFNKTNGYDLSYSGGKGECWMALESGLFCPLSVGGTRLTLSRHLWCKVLLGKRDSIFYPAACARDFY